MSTAERFEAEPPPPPAPGRSTSGKILMGCGIGCGVLALVCCGGFTAISFFSYRMASHAIDKDPAHVRTMTAELATINVPAGLEPKLAIDAKIPFVGKSLFKAAVYTDGRESNDGQIFAIGEVTGAMEVDQNHLRNEIDRAFAKQEERADANDEFQSDKSHTLELEIRGEPAKFFIEEGALRASHKKMIRAMGQFAGHEGTALLFLQLDAEQHSADQVEQLLRSIQ
jgi:hypothetical protein